jgi:hypothetical protein
MREPTDLLTTYDGRHRKAHLWRMASRSPGRRSLAMLAATVTVAGVLQFAPAALGSTVSSAVLTGGAGTQTVGGILYAKNGGALTLTVTTSSDTKCVDVGAAFAARQTSTTAKTSWTFTATASTGDGIQTVTANASPSFNANNCTGQSQSPGSASYTLDNTGPIVTAALSPAANAAGWNNSNVGITWSATDAGSGVASGPTPGSDSQNSSTTTAGVAKTATATDRLGNVGNGSVTVKLDKAAPSITGTRLPLGNGFGWNNTDVTVSFSCTDALSGTDANTVAGATVSAEGSDQSVTNSGACTDMAGNTANPATVSGINIDKTPPTAFDFIGGGLSDGGSYYFGSVPLGPTSCSANGSISGLNGTCSVSGYSTTVGSQTVTATATDKAGNTGHAHISYSVLAWTLLGFYQPVNMIQNYVNTVKNGSTVPLKFEIFAGQTELTSTADVKSFALASVSCLAFDGQVTDPVDFTTTGGTTLRYDTTAGQFIQNWQTPKKPNTCWVVTMTAQDGSTIVSDFQLK